MQKIKFNGLSDEKMHLGLLGGRLEHSLSPVIQAVAAEIAGIETEYPLFEIREEELGEMIRELKTTGFRGCNVTIPFKEKVLDYVDERTPLVEAVGASNTLLFDNGIVIADNTDCRGFLDGWALAGFSPMEGKTAVVLGAGGASAAVCYALVSQKVSSIFIFNRNMGKGKKLAKKIEDTAGDAAFRVFNLDDRPGLSDALKNSDFLINTTPVGMFPHVDLMPIDLPDAINPDLEYYDLIYNPDPTCLTKKFLRKGHKASGGFGMLVSQGLNSFHKWTGRTVDLSVAIKRIKAEIHK